MRNFSLLLRLGLSLLLLGTTVAVRGQAPVITAVVPTPNAHAVARNGSLVVRFDQPLTGMPGALRVYSHQRGGLRSRGVTPAVLTANMLSYSPTPYAFAPGETLWYTVTTAAASSNGSLARPRVGQFTTAVGGSGRGSFVLGSDPAIANVGRGVAVADVDGDGDLDILAATFGGSVSVRLNGGNASGSNTGVFSAGQNVAVGPFPDAVAVGDVNGDGDVDLLAVNTTTNDVSVRLNNGAGVFSGAQNVAVGPYPTGLTLGDVDGDGDLDLLCASLNDGTVAVRLNGGDATGSNTGVFSGGTNVAVGGTPIGVAVGDVDNDGDLDLLATSTVGNTIAVRLNGGDNTGSNTGLFSGGQTLPVGRYPRALATSDLDGDGDLDLLVSNLSDNSVSIVTNGGSAPGLFSVTQVVTGIAFPYGLTAGDVDGDGDIDLACTGSLNRVYVRLNGGNASGSNTGVFSGGGDVPVGSSPLSVVLGDLDGDGDIDLVTGNEGSATVSVRFNGGTALATHAKASPATLVLTPNPAHDRVSVVGAVPGQPLQLIDPLGRIMVNMPAPARTTAQVLLPVGLAPGLYWVRSGGRVHRLLVE